jgi:hypothetical protein
MRSLSVLAFFVLTGFGSSSIAATSACPGLSPEGKRQQLTPPEFQPNLVAYANDHAPGNLAAAAQAIVSKFETGSAKGYEKVSATDKLSVGISQWNHGSGSLYSMFFPLISQDMLNRAPSAIRDDLVALKTDKNRREEIINSWLVPREGDSLEKGVRSSVRRALSEWLAIPEIVAVQQKLTAKSLDSAWRLAKAWQAEKNPKTPVSLKLFTNFYDVVIYNGGFADVWVQHVVAFRKSHPDTATVLAKLEEWTTNCQNFSAPIAEHKNLYSLKDLRRSVQMWKEAAKSHPELFDDETLDLLALGLLRAQRSVGSNSPKGFPGVFQADVMLRRGTEAIGIGYRGAKIGPLYP